MTHLYIHYPIVQASVSHLVRFIVVEPTYPGLSTLIIVNI